MKHLRYLLLAALVAMPLTACDEDTAIVEDVTIIGRISGTVTVDGAGMSGVSVTLVGPTSQAVTTGSGGTFTFSSVEAGIYGVSISTSNTEVTFAESAKTATITTQGQTATVDFAGAYIRTGSIQGVVLAGTTGVVGVTATLTGGPESLAGSTAVVATSTVGGAFSYSGLRKGTYTVTLSNVPTNVMIADLANDVTIGEPGGSATTAFAGDLLENAMISGVVLADGEALGQVTVTLSGAATAETITNAAGEYAFMNLLPGSYTVTISGYDADVAFSRTTYTSDLNYGDHWVLNFGGEGNTADVAIERITNLAGASVDRNNVLGRIIVTWEWTRATRTFLA